MGNGCCSRQVGFLFKGPWQTVAQLNDNAFPGEGFLVEWDPEWFP